MGVGDTFGCNTALQRPESRGFDSKGWVGGVIGICSDFPAAL